MDGDHKVFDNHSILRTLKGFQNNFSESVVDNRCIKMLQVLKALRVLMVLKIRIGTFFYDKNIFCSDMKRMKAYVC